MLPERVSEWIVMGSKRSLSYDDISFRNLSDVYFRFRRSAVLLYEAQGRYQQVNALLFGPTSGNAVKTEWLYL